MRIFVTLLLAATAAAADPKPGDVGTPEHEKAAALVQQLGDKRYASREAAARKLIEMGPAAIPALTSGTRSDDEEVRNRSLVLLPQAKAAEWKRRAEAYLNDKAAKRNHDLPLLSEWEKLVGKPDAGSRKLFADMVRTNGELFQLAAADPKSAAEMVKVRCRAISGQVAASATPVSAEPGELAAILFVHCRVSKERANWRAFDHPAMVLGNPGIADAIASKEIGPAFRRVVVEWAQGHAADDVTSHQFFVLAARKTPFPEAVPVLARLAGDKNASRLNVRAVSIEALGKIGGNEAKAALAELITDTTSLFQGVVDQDFRIGDCAFTALITAHGKKPADYGVLEALSIAFRTGIGTEVIDLRLQTFPNDETRQKGLKKWKDDTEKK